MNLFLNRLPRAGRCQLALCVALAALSACSKNAERPDVRGQTDRSDDKRENVIDVSPVRLPHNRRDDGYVGAAACRECHEKQHETWHHSYHRTMTQAVNPSTVLADFSNSRLHSRGRDFRLWRDGDEFWAEMVDPEWDARRREAGDNSDSASPPVIQRKIVMSTGSHHFQTYWINGTRGNELWQVPWVYHLEEKIWMPAEDAFVAPPDSPRRVTNWNDNCIECHAVAGQPGLDPQAKTFNSRVADLGIACESCHGPGQRHIEHHRGQQKSASADPTRADPIVNPSRLPHDRASHVCAQCHSYFSFSDEHFWQTGFTYRPGDDLTESRVIHDYASDHVQSRPDLKAAYWGDGTCRLAGREFTAMDDSACFQKGKLSCFSCHSLHEYQDRSDQLAVGMAGNQACLQCHDKYRENISQHTHHAAESTGSLCYNCHMPHTSFGLLKAIRSHRIDSPTARMTSDHGRPNACNLCHVDQSLGWTAEHLESWYGQDRPDLSADDKEIPMTLRMLLQGDAAQRAVVAWNLGRPEVVERDPAWPQPFLALTLLDSYSAVRFSAFQSLRRYPGFETFRYDFVAPSQQRGLAMRRAVEQWRNEGRHEKVESPGTFLLRADGTMMIEEVQRLMQSRDEQPVWLPE